VPKQYLLLAGKPVILHTLERIDGIREIREIVIVCTSDYVDVLKDMIKQYNISTEVKFALAGKTRQESVKSGLMQVSKEYVIIHEAARPFVSEQDFKRLIDEPCENAMYGAPIPFTVLKGQEYVEGLLNRSELVNVQLPQKFNASLLKEVHEMAEIEERVFTEDAGMVYYYHPEIKVKICEGMDYNIKLTTPTDLVVGEIIYKEYFARRK